MGTGTRGTTPTPASRYIDANEIQKANMHQLNVDVKRSHRECAPPSTLVATRTPSRLLASAVVATLPRRERDGNA
jgi:hypothetical protein